MNSILPAGTRLGRYEIKSRLGAGGMGEVYLAEDLKLGRKVALKILPPLLATEEGRAQRFIREAKAASNLNHPNILTVYESDEDGGAHYIATEYVEGETLRAHIRRGALPPREALGIAVQIASALSAAHAARVVHRDVKPENIMLRPDGYVKVLDFGIAKLLQRVAGTETTEIEHAITEEALNTERGVVLGTVEYMSPEQARGQEVDARTDIFSLGVVLYEMLTGHTPFHGPTKADVIAAILYVEPLPLARLVPDASDELERVVRRTLAKEREDRYQTSAELLEDLRRLRESMKAAAAARGPVLTGETIIRSQTSRPRGAETPTAQQTTEQRRQVTVLFADFSGLAEMLGHLDDEELGDVMNELWRRVESLIAEAGGKVDKQLGDELMAVWGAGAAREDDPEHAIRAALALREEVSEFARRRGGASAGGLVGEEEATRLLRVGINTGTALLGASLTGELQTTGAAVTAARRLKNASHEGAVVISHDTYRHVRGVFDVQEVTSAGGTDISVLAYTVLRAKPRAFRLRTRGVEGVETRMVGRKSELKRLTDALETVFEDRELQGITILGDAGLGKSRLLYEFVNRVELLPDAWYVFQGRASEATEGSPYALVRELFSLRFGIQDSDAPEAAREKLERGFVQMSGEGSEAAMRAQFIGQLAGLDFSGSGHLSGILDDARQIRDRAFHYAAEFFASLARQSTPVLLMLDDIHWADDGSLDFVDYLMRACADAPVLVLSASRPTLLERRARWGEGQSSHTRLILQPLSKRESRQLVEEIMRQAASVPQELRELVVARAEGNPFYVEELIKMLIDQRAILPGADEWRVDTSRLGEVQVPATLTGVLQARLDGLTLREKVLLQRASVLGREFWDEAVEHLGSEEGESRGAGRTAGVSVHEILQSLRRKELIYQREASSFASAGEYVFKHALLRDVTYETLLRRDRRRLHHRAAEWLAQRSGVRAGEYAATIAEHFERAEEPRQAAEWYGRAGRQARDSHSPEASTRYYRRALELMPAAEAEEDTDAPRQRSVQALDWYEGLGEVLWRQARLAEASEAYDAMRAEAANLGDAAAEARAWNGLSLVADARGDTRSALDGARRAEQLSRRAKDSTQGTSALVTALLRQGYASYRLGDATEVVRLGAEAFALSSEPGAASKSDRARALHLLGTGHQMLGDYERAYSCKEQSLALMRELGDRQNSGAMLNALGETARLRGDYARAAELYREALAIARETGNLSQQLVYLGNLGGARAGAGDYAGAEADLREVVRMAGDTDHFALSEVHRFLARALLGQGKTDEALEAARAALTLGSKTGNQEFIGGAWRVLGLVAASLPHPFDVEGETITAGACFAESYRVFAEMGMDAERARAIRDWASFEESRGDTEHAAAMREEAREIFTRLGMDAEIERMNI